MITHDEADCPRCRECPSCEGGQPLATVVVRIRGGVTHVCADCMGEGVLCYCDCHS